MRRHHVRLRWRRLRLRGRLLKIPLPHRLLFRGFCGLQPRGLFTPSLLSVCWVKVWNVIYAFGFTGWLPFSLARAFSR